MREIDCKQRQLSVVGAGFVPWGLSYGEGGRKDPATKKMDIYSIWPTTNIVPTIALDLGSRVGTLMNIISACPVLIN